MESSERRLRNFKRVSRLWLEGRNHGNKDARSPWEKERKKLREKLGATREFLYEGLSSRIGGTRKLEKLEKRKPT